MSTKLRHENLGTATLMSIVGDLSFETVGALKTQIERITADNRRPVVMDLSDVDFIDSKGAGFLLQMKQKLNDRKLALASVPSRVRNTLDRLHIVEQFRVFVSTDDALRWVKPIPAQVPLAEPSVGGMLY
jgi:anti-anti-sigma factor